MIEFPETARVEWQVIHDAAQIEKQLRARIARDTLIEKELETLRIRHEANEQFNAELDADSTPVLEMFTVDQFQATPAMAPDDLIEGVMKDRGLTIVMGPSGAGKSTFALQMAHCLMTGEDFLTQQVRQISGGVGVMSYDMDGGLMADWVSGFPGNNAHRVGVVNAHKRGNPMGVPALRAQIIAWWKSLNVEIVIIDSFGASFFGENQNDQAAVTSHYRDMGKFALTEVGARGLIVISHSTLGSPYKIRGSTVHHDVADTICAVVADEKQPNPAIASREVRMVKYRQHRTAAGTMSHQMQTLAVGAPDSVTHLVSVDPGAMTLAGMTPPQGSAAFDTYEEPDTDSSDEGDDDL